MPIFRSDFRVHFAGKTSKLGLALTNTFSLTRRRNGRIVPPTTHLKKFRYHVCPQAFLSLNYLQSHIRVVHGNQRDYPCTFCDKSFSAAGSLKRHVETKHATNEELIHSCDKCEYKSHSKYYLANHKRNHNAGRYGFYFCGKKFIAFYVLVEHYRRHTLE
ncbi:B lymphocyte-induced maturation protein 1 [Folsomia candida]|uniref:B lymphocyte-induced maturation protein 1 n=1 Tax=Folsomia candida TaxID=158441 RepID=A0A226DL40_FOLCA|nr:B lymphocyte-induced maturation protein 1 [Folsomia candida]